MIATSLPTQYVGLIGVVVGVGASFLASYVTRRWGRTDSQEEWLRSELRLVFSEYMRVMNEAMRLADSYESLMGRASQEPGDKQLRLELEGARQRLLAHLHQMRSASTTLLLVGSPRVLAMSSHIQGKFLEIALTQDPETELTKCTEALNAGSHRYINQIYQVRADLGVTDESDDIRELLRNEMRLLLSA